MLTTQVQYQIVYIPRHIGIRSASRTYTHYNSHFAGSTKRGTVSWFSEEAVLMAFHVDI